MGTQFPTTLQQDPPVSLDANYRLTNLDRRLIDDQIRGVQGILVSTLVGGTVATFIALDGGSAAVTKGQAVCLSSNTGAPAVTLATTTPLGLAGAVFGIALVPAQPGSLVLVAVGGVVPPSVTGLASGSPGYVKANTGTGGLSLTTSPLPSDFLIGTLDNGGNLFIAPVPVGLFDSTVTAGVWSTTATEIDVPGGAFAMGAAGSKAWVGTAASNTTDGTTWVNYGPQWNLPALTGTQSCSLTVAVEVAAQNTGATGGTNGDAYGYFLIFRVKKIGTAAPTVTFTGGASNAGGDAGESAVSGNAQIAFSGVTGVQPQVKGVTGHTLRQQGSVSVTFGG